MENCDEMASLLWRIFDSASELHSEGVRALDYWKLYSMYDIYVNLVKVQRSSNCLARCCTSTSSKSTVMRKTDFHSYIELLGDEPSDVDGLGSLWHPIHLVDGDSHAGR